MRWHHDHVYDGETMTHPSDSPAWRNFTETHPHFASEIRNVRLALSADGFQPFGQTGQQYSSWPVIMTPYNLPSWMCMKDEYMFLTVLAPGPKNPKDKLDVFLQPLIAELQSLWVDGTVTYDVHSRTNITLRAALMWTISYFPAYAMLSGWSTAGKQACPHCMSDSEAFTLPHSRKTCWFGNHRKFLPVEHPLRHSRNLFRRGRTVSHTARPTRSGFELLDELDSYGFLPSYEVDTEEHNKELSKLLAGGWRKRSIFWELPYWSSNMVRHNLDVMHIDKNVFDNIFNTLMNVPEKTKDNAKSRADLCRNVHKTRVAFRYWQRLISKGNIFPRKRRKTSSLKMVERYTLSVFKVVGRSIGASKSRHLQNNEYHAVATYMLLNCAETRSFVQMYENHLRSSVPGIYNADVDAQLQQHFFQWFKNYETLNQDFNISPDIKQLALGPQFKVKCLRGYCVNGFKFHTKEDSTHKATDNSGVHVRGVAGDGTSTNYYGIIDEILEVKYAGNSQSKTVLFKCTWFDTHPRLGTRVHPKYKIVEINRKRSLRYYDPFVFCTQASQVVYLAYPSTKKIISDWVYVGGLKKREYIQQIRSDTDQVDGNVANEAFQNHESQSHGLETQLLLNTQNLVYVTVMYDNDIDVGTQNSDTDDVQAFTDESSNNQSEDSE
ncbi:uncharacterized protein [Henckelia pumila]|uniref:uncharacterized protein n=1 Tax=Henckelia pumila TaxID=405737 RepID=UPI003C6E4905